MMVCKTRWASSSTLVSVSKGSALLGMRQCLTLPDLWRFVLRARGHSLYTFMEVHLVAADFADWMRQDYKPRVTLR